ncbi:MAG: HlyD family efflux transporter periplasmic adaptor subunit, partial [Bacteroidales bacterium]|nr:HlyD family efflux transporter periplasmic adaptor subunit [Bacteroidales bacterium]
IPSTGIGKVKPGQTVNIKLDNYPYMEFGIIKAKIKNISLVPISTEQGIFYTAEIEINDSVLITNYNKSIPFSQNMTGIAEIITDDVRLLERFLNPLRSIWRESVK